MAARMTQVVPTQADRDAARAREVLAEFVDLDGGTRDDAIAAMLAFADTPPIHANAEGRTPSTDHARLREARAELEAVAALIERPPLDDVLLERPVALGTAAAIRTVLAALTHDPLADAGEVR